MHRKMKSLSTTDSIEFLHREKYIINKSERAKDTEKEKKMILYQKNLHSTCHTDTIMNPYMLFALPIIYSLTKVRATST